MKISLSHWYLWFVERILSPLLGTYPWLVVRECALSHFIVDVRNHLSATFPDRWIGRGPIPCLFFLRTWSLRLRPEKLHACVTVTATPVRVPRQQPLAPCVTSVTSVANNKGDNEMIPGPVHRSPGTCFTAEENPGKNQLGDRLMKELCDQSSPQMGSLFSK